MDEYELYEEEVDNCFDLDMKNRLLCGFALGALGIFFSFISLSGFPGNTFAVLYGIASIAAIGGSFFICNWKKHLEKLRVYTLELTDFFKQYHMSRTADG